MSVEGVAIWSRKRRAGSSKLPVLVRFVPEMLERIEGVAVGLGMSRMFIGVFGRGERI
jgi:hypothetical protein